MVGCVYIKYSGPRRPVEGVEFPELELPAMVSHPAWVLGAELRFSAGAVGAGNS